MYKRLLELLEGPFSGLIKKGKGHIEYYSIPEGKVEEVRKLLGVEINETNLARCENGPKGHKSSICVEIFLPEDGGQPTAQLYCVPFDQTTAPFVYLSPEVVLN